VDADERVVGNSFNRSLTQRQLRDSCSHNGRSSYSLGDIARVMGQHGESNTDDSRDKDPQNMPSPHLNYRAPPVSRTRLEIIDLNATKMISNAFARPPCLVSTNIWDNSYVKILAACGYYVLVSDTISFALFAQQIQSRQPLRWPMLLTETPLGLITPSITRRLCPKPTVRNNASPVQLLPHHFEGRRVIKITYWTATDSQQITFPFWPPPSFTDALQFDDQPPKIFTLREALDLMVPSLRLPSEEPIYDKLWPSKIQFTLPLPLVPRLGHLDLDATAWRKQDLTTFSMRHVNSTEISDLQLMPWPQVNLPPITSPKPRALRDVRDVDVTALFQSQVWNVSIPHFLRLDKLDHANIPVSHRGEHRRRATPLILSEAASLALTGGHIVDLRPCFGSDGSIIRSTAVAMAPTPVSSKLNIAFMKSTGHKLGFQDKDLFDQLEYGFTNDSKSPRSTRLYPCHLGAFKYYKAVQDSLQHDIDQGWISRPYTRPPIWPAVAVPRNAIQQYKGFNKYSVRVTTDMSEMQSDHSINAGIDLTQEPHLEMVRIHDYLLSIAILLSKFEDVHLWKSDLTKYYRHIPKSKEELFQQLIVWDGNIYLDERSVFGDAIMVHKSTRLATFIVFCLRKMNQKRYQECIRNNSPLITRPILEFLSTRLQRLGLDQADLSFICQYIDDMLGCAPTKALAISDKDEALKFVQQCGLEIQPDKVVGPVTKIEALGVVISLPERTASLSEKFVSKLELRTTEVLTSTSIPAKLIESLAFSHSTISTFDPTAKPLATASLKYWYAIQNSRTIIPSQEFQDLAREMLRYAKNKPSIPLNPALLFPERTYHQRLDIEMDASGDIGWGFIALSNSPSRLHEVAWDLWDEEEKQWHINIKELAVSCYAAATLGPASQNFYVVEAIDNSVAERVALQNKSTGPALRAIQQKRIQYHLQFNWIVHQQRISSADNDLADALSRNKMIEFAQAAYLRRIKAHQLRRIFCDLSVRHEIKKLVTQVFPQHRNDTN